MVKILRILLLLWGSDIDGWIYPFSVERKEIQCKYNIAGYIFSPTRESEKKSKQKKTGIFPERPIHLHTHTRAQNKRKEKFINHQFKSNSLRTNKLFATVTATAVVVVVVGINIPGRY